MKKLFIVGLFLFLVACDTTIDPPVGQNQPSIESSSPVEEEREQLEESEVEEIPQVEATDEDVTFGSLDEIQQSIVFSDVPSVLQGIRFVATGGAGFTNDIHQNDGRNFPIGYFKAYYQSGHTIDIQITSRNQVQNYEPFVAQAYRLAKTIGQMPMALQEQITDIEIMNESSTSLQLNNSTVRVGIDTLNGLRDTNLTFVRLFTLLKAEEEITRHSPDTDMREYWIGLWWAAQAKDEKVQDVFVTNSIIITSATLSQYAPLELPNHATMNIATGQLATQLVNPNDPSSLVDVTFLERGTRYHVRGDSWTGSLSGPFQANVFVARYTEGKTMNFVIEASIPFSDAERIANEAAFIYGQAPALLRAGMRDFIIFPGSGHPSSGPVTTFYWDIFYRLGSMIEEGLIHDMAHASLDWPARNETYDIKDNQTLVPHPGVTTRAAWLNAARLDDYYASTYGKDNPEREDIAESIIPYLILRWRPERFDPYYLKFIEETIPNRIAYLDTFDFGFPEDNK